MKVSTSIVALAAGLGQVSATYFHNAPPFTCPGNSNNHCLDEYRAGLNWQDLQPGSFDKYKGFLWKGFQAADRFSKRSELAPRKFQDKCIAGKAHPSKDQSPKMSCDKSAGNVKTSIKEFQIETAFDCDLEFHYGMPDGSICKQRHHCPKAGTTIPNNQCGGATDVTIVYPSQPNKPKDGCDFAIPSIVFDCDNHTPTSTYSVVKPPQSTSTTYHALPPVSSSATTSSTAAATTSSTPGGDIYSTKSVPENTYTTKSVPENTYTPSVPATTSSSSPQDSTSSAFFPSGTSSSAGASSSSGSSSAPEGTYSFTQPSGAGSTSSAPADTTSSSAGPDNTYSASVPAQSSSSTLAVSESSSSSSSGFSSATTYVPGTTSGPAETPYTTTSTPSGTASVPAPPPVETLPCPNVVPSCLNTWMFIVTCIDNTDSACYCPDEKFVKNVFDCMYAHGETDDIIKEAVEYFQGICAPFVPQNPAIGTGAQTITNILTITATAPPTATYTTIEITATSIVPVTDSQGSEIPDSSTTITYSTTVSVPEVHFTTITSEPGSTQIGIIPGPTVYPTAAAPGVPTATPTDFGPYPTVGNGGATTLITSKPGQQPTGGIFPSGSAIPTIPTAGAGRVGAGLASLMAGVVAAAAAALVL
ncbi:uncharacterized protein B0I36DRAFT_313874 [Microdochium trichocladiopsis]|uniref:CFEM domain-containing protein n=1 Tax=Microdochium trichocladiopsis TaxID=1682393 RepID=A0A9P8YED8_9PEZI|nr:uncharacterized protein B0I36DRAFT_313874 [Microdochium trichocladiopsis]KAH7037357.1 hypothetical protein B0I36DRAFT_313874 [Microdochium trichocladiopsis]